jgi:hypothetical protein
MSVDRHLGRLLVLRLRARGNRQATKLIDQGLALIAEAARANPSRICELDAKVAQLADDVALRMGPPDRTEVH